MATAGDVLEAAYNRSTLNAPGKLALDGELLEHLDRTYQSAWALIARARPDQYGTALTVSLTGSPPTATLPDTLIDVTHAVTATGAAVSVAPAADRGRTWQLAPCVFRRGYTLVSRFQAGDPIAGATLTLDVLLAPTPLTARTTPIDARWPARHIQLLVDRLATYLSVKDAERSQNDRAALATELKGSAATFGAEFGLAPADIAWLHGDIERGGLPTSAGAA